MKKLIPSICGCFFAAISSLPSETLFSPGSITIATNETILINSMGPSTHEMYLDGGHVALNTDDFTSSPRYAIAGPHTLTTSNIVDPSFITFQRLQGSSIKTVVIQPNSTNIISVPSGKTIQLFSEINLGADESNIIRPSNSTNVYRLFGNKADGVYFHPSVTGPVTIELLGSSDAEVGIVSYYFTDEVLQLPPSGFLAIPAPKLEVNIEKSYNLTNWVPTSVFNTDAENGAFYRLRMLK